MATETVDWPYSRPRVQNVFDRPPYDKVFAAQVGEISLADPQIVPQFCGSIPPKGIIDAR